MPIQRPLSPKTPTGSSTPPPSSEKAWKRPPITIFTPRLRIRPYHSDDVEDIFAMRSNPETMKWSSSMVETDISQSREWLEKYKDVPHTYNFVIELLPENAPAPTVSSSPSPQRNKVIGTIGSHKPPEIGYCLHPAFFGRGYATEAWRAFMPVFWSTIAPVEGGLEYAEADTDPENRASHRVLEKCGFHVWKVTEGDYQSPMLGLRGTILWRCWKDGKAKMWEEEGHDERN